MPDLAIYSQILIVDDIPNWRQLLNSFISDMGYFCTTASTVEEAKKILGKQSVKLAILDIRLDDSNPHDVSGLEILDWIANNCKDTKVIMYTGYASVSYVQKAFSYKDTMIAFVEKAGEDLIELFHTKIPEIMESP